jgi:1,4-alpha-glucan branching enzyme
VQELVRSLNRSYRDEPALWEQDFTGEGFRWIDASDVDSNVLSFLRLSAEGGPLVCVANLSPVPRPGSRIGLPSGGTWRELVNTDDVGFGGSGVGNGGQLSTTDGGWHGMPFSVDLTLPPLGVLWLVPEERTPAGG